MKERSLAILKMLIKNPETKVTDIEKEMRLSKRQINYSIKALNDYLDENKYPTISRSHSGKFTIPKEVYKLFIPLSEEQRGLKRINSDYYSEYERIIILSMYLAITNDYISLAHIHDLLNVSKNTALNDVRNTESFLQRYNLSVHYSRQLGYQLQGEEKQVRVLINDLTAKLNMLDNTQNPLSDLVKISADKIIHLIHEVEKELSITYADAAFDFIRDCLGYTLTRIARYPTKAESFFHNKVNDTPEHGALKKLLPSILQVSSDDIEWITLIFLSANVYEKNTALKIYTDNRIDSLIIRMIDKFEQLTFIRIEERENFERRLLSHMRPACFRVRYGLQLGDLGLAKKQKDTNHTILLELMKELVEDIEAELGNPFPPNELELLSFYFGHQLSPQEEDAPKKRAVVVCTNGMVVSKIMMENLKNLFPEIHFLSTFSIRDFYLLEDDFDLVFTNVPLESKITQYIINSVMTSTEQINLRYRVLKDLGINEVDAMVEQITDIVSKNAEGLNIRELKETLRTYFLDKSKKTPSLEYKVLPKLEYYIEKEYVQLENRKMDWKEALRLASKPLLKEGVIEERYIDDLERQISSPDNYSFLGECMAIPHSNPGEGALKDGIGILISKEPIIFPGGKKIHFLVPMSITNLSIHLRAVNQLANLALDGEKLSNLLQAETAEAAYTFLMSLN